MQFLQRGHMFLSQRDRHSGTDEWQRDQRSLLRPQKVLANYGTRAVRAYECVGRML